jgi:TetR/AcrR family transcriptional regulator, cholesterol catabolism regulator
MVTAAVTMAAPLRTAREQRADETRSRIFASAAELFTSSGYHATTVDRIVERAQVAKGTFFVHFKSKAAVVAELVRIQTSAARRARARALESEGPLEALRAAVMTLGAHAGSSRTLSRAVLAAGLESPEVGDDISALFDETYSEMIADARAAERAGLLREGSRGEALAACLMASYLGAALHFTTTPRSEALVQVLEQLVQANFAGACRPRRRPPAPRKETEHAPRSKGHQRRGS